MARIFTEDFTGGSPGDALSTTNSAFTTSVAPGWTFSTAQLTSAIGRTQSGLNAPAGAAAAAVGPFASTSTPWVRIALRVATRNTATATIAALRSGTAVACDLQVLTTGQLRLRNSAGTAVLTSGSAVIALNTNYLIEWRYDGTLGQQQVRVFSGANINGATATYDSGTVTTTAAGAVDTLSLGVSTVDTASMYFGAVAVDNANWVGPALNVLTVTGSGALAFAGTANPAATLARSGSGSLTFGSTLTGGGPLAITGAGDLTLTGPPPPAADPVSVWNGQSWVSSTVFVWDGGVWQLASVEVLAGTPGGGSGGTPGSYSATYPATY